eukprot:m.441891 g.441891  ORF g.441891 m.441891 type:complete len:52 (-) comp21470_c0_seq17:1915-2070(-)
MHRIAQNLTACCVCGIGPVDLARLAIIRKEREEQRKKKEQLAARKAAREGR